ncbi:MAG TPA: tetratricopeptide repeat protein [Longimicrobiales bacterium]|nr:tetratricopeptide repeat protein [Longimicrobiales bacterium]
MDESAAALRPLDEVADAIDRLGAYESTSDLAAALLAVRDAVERTLRLRLRNDPSAPEHERITAMSARDLPLPEVVQSLRTRDLISLETAGTVHEFEAAAARARAGEPRAADADRALRAVAGLRDDLGAGHRAAVPPAPAASAPGVRGDTEEEKPPERRGRWMAWLGAALAALFLLTLAWVLVQGGGADRDAAVVAFRAGRLDSAAVGFERVLEDRPEDVGALLYLGRIRRRQGRVGEAAEHLRQAAGLAPADGDVRRELGHLFMDLGQPTAAVRQYERALEADAEEPRTWAALIRALRAAGDPRAEQLLADAPAEVQALLGRPGL